MQAKPNAILSMQAWAGSALGLHYGCIIRHGCFPAGNARYVLALSVLHRKSKLQLYSHSVDRAPYVLSLPSRVHCYQKRPLHCPADLTVGSTCHCRRRTRLTHPLPPLLTLRLHTKRNSKPRLQSQSVDRLCCSLVAIDYMCALLPEATNALPSGSDSYLTI